MQQRDAFRLLRQQTLRVYKVSPQHPASTTTIPYNEKLVWGATMNSKRRLGSDNPNNNIDGAKRQKSSHSRSGLSDIFADNNLNSSGTHILKYNSSMSMPLPSASTQVRSRSTRALTIDPDKIKYDTPKVVLGGGTFGTVYKSKANSFPGGLTVAVKVLKTRQFTPAECEKAWKSLLKEARAMKNVSHHNLCKFHGLSSNVNKQLLVMEYIDGDSLHHYMHLDHAIQISEKSKFGMAKQIAEGLEYLHCVAKLVHGDICPNNIMVTRDGKQTIKIVDFGLARSIEGASCSLSTSLLRKYGGKANCYDKNGNNVGPGKGDLND